MCASPTAASRFEVEIDESTRGMLLPPMSVQQLVENAIKHNRHSAEEPLHIDIRREGNHISVCNPVAPLFSAAEPSTGIGQKNIAERYALLSDRQMIVSFTRDTYAVKLPILEN